MAIGINISVSACSGDGGKPSKLHPNQLKYKVVRSYIGRRGDAMVLEVNYPDCINYEGRKILVYIGVSFLKLMDQGSIDPHFLDNKDYYSPFARFEPTPFGWDCAKELVDRLDI